MSKNKYHLVSVENRVQWDDFVETSPQGSIFSLSWYLEAIKREYALYYICKGNEVKAGICLILSHDRNACVLDDLVIYNGILFRADSEQKWVRSINERFAITEYVIGILSDRYQSIELALAPQLNDIRPFLWHNYHSPHARDKYFVDLRYTSYLDISSLLDCKDRLASSLFKGMDSLRQRNIREGIEKGAKIHESNDIEQFLVFYEKLMAAQDTKISDAKRLQMHSVISAILDSRHGFMLATTSNEGKVIYMTVFGFDSKRAYYLFGAGDLEARERFKGTFGFWESFIRLADLGIKEVDFEGINSPLRGRFKLSFGGTIIPYFQLYLNSEAN